MSELLYPEGAYVPPRPPQDHIDARIQAFENANFLCTVQQEGCTENAPFAHQKKLIIKDGSSGYERYVDGVMQTSNNLVVCCPSCHRWIHDNQQEATSLGYLNR